MTESLMSRDRAEAKKKGTIALAAWLGTGILAFYAPLFAVIGGAGAAYLTYRWFMFRAKRGMRF
jgi:threonine/homoserine/homoserine lactone efflux protein